MAYDASKDRVLDTWENEETGLQISIKTGKIIQGKIIKEQTR